MREKSTDELQRELLEAMDLDQFLSGNRGQFSCESVAGALDRLFRQKNISKTALARRSGMSEIYLYQILSGRRSPGGATPRATGLSASAAGWGPRWMRRRSC